MPEYKIVFLPSNQTATFADGTTFRDAALELGIIIESSCAGIGTCAKCKVNIKDGACPPTAVETELLTPKELDQGVRLSCQATLTGDSLCVVPETSRLTGEQILTDGGKSAFALEPDIAKVLVTVPRAQIGEKYFDFEKLLHALRQQGCSIAGYRLHTIKQIANLLRKHDFELTAVIDQDQLLAIEPGDSTATLYGVACDIGTTTVAAKLVDLNTGHIVAVASALNPQRPHGADVVSRVNYIVEHTGGLNVLHNLIIKEINALVAQLCTDAGIQRHEVYKMTLVGNTVMQHIALGIDPRHLAYKPYTPAFQGPITLDAATLGVKINSAGVVYCLPNLACFVGSDITAVLTVLDIEQQDDGLQLVVDIGTNGEMVLGSRDRLLCCSSPAGPAWEGAYIAWGMRAARGAIERAEIIDGELQFRTIGNVDPIGICGSGLLDLVSEFLRAGVIDRTGRILKIAELGAIISESLQARLVPQENGTNDIAIARIAGNRAILLLQKDLREVQLAKATIAAGIAILLKELGHTPADLKNVFIAGAFGNHVRAQDAILVGLIPPLPEERIKFIGNAALAGAEAVLRSRSARQKAEQLAQVVDYVEISDRTDFQEIFVDSMHFPMTTGTKTR